MWRSGTSALYALLNQHPQIALLFEGDLELLSSGLGAKKKPQALLARWNFWNRATVRHGLDEKDIAEHSHPARPIAEAAYRSYASHKGALIRGEKSPSYYDRLTQLAETYPGARFLIIWRNPLHICASILSARNACYWFARRGMILRALLGFRRMKQECDLVRARGIPICELNYEELVDNTDAVMRGVCQFLGLPFDPRVKSLDGADVSAIYAERHHTKVRRESIHFSPEQTHTIPHELRRKVQRYIAYWKRESGGTWPSYPRNIDPPLRHLGVLERTADYLGYTALRAYDRTVIAIYRIAPLFVLSMYRKSKNWYQDRRRSVGSVSEWMAISGLRVAASPPSAKQARSSD